LDIQTWLLQEKLREGNTEESKGGDEKLKLKKWIEAYRCKYH
jgi:hypothetical protein